MRKMQNGVTLEYLKSVEACAVPHCGNVAGAGRLFCKGCWLALPNRSRRKLWRVFKAGGYLDVRAFWRLVSIRLAQRVVWLNAEVDRHAQRESLYMQAEQLASAGLNLDCINRMALRIQELEAQLPDVFTR